MSEGYDESSNWCYGTYCDQNGNVINWDNFKCKSTTVTPTTTPITTVPTQFGCYDDNGKFFNPGEKMSEGYDESSNWCYGTYCDQGGNVINWDNFKCKSTTVTPTTTPITTVPTQFGCYDENGKFFNPGENMSTEGYDESTYWCYGYYCSESGSVVGWESFNCKSTTVSPTITPITTVPTELDI